MPLAGRAEPRAGLRRWSAPCPSMRSTAMKSIALYLLGVPIVVIILLNVFGLL